ncbi:hypothetical protein CSPAE12_04495 [Colletotrichum incanum]|nr:hypothetical protein CSPAE12_04495 [Colletotrichum incanum]
MKPSFIRYRYASATSSGLPSRLVRHLSLNSSVVSSGSVRNNSVVTGPAETRFTRNGARSHARPLTRPSIAPAAASATAQPGIGRWELEPFVNVIEASGEGGMCLGKVDFRTDARRRGTWARRARAEVMWW